MADRKRTPELGEIQETLLIPLYARAVETRKRHGMLSDPRAVEMVDSLDYDFSRFDGARSLLGSNVRTLLIDAWVAEFLGRHPDGTVVEIGTGLNTRFERLDNGRTHWFDLDLPDVIDLRRAFFEDTPRRRMLAGSVDAPEWTAAVRERPGPYFLAAEAVLIYLEEARVRAVFEMIARELPGAWLALETASGRMVGTQDSHDVLSKVAARMHWQCDDPAEILSWVPGLTLETSCTFAALPAAVRTRLPARYRAMLRAASVVKRKDIESYRFHLFRFPS
ncbi:class I SAM-dependent methyltransferase [Streptomyces sp. NPDC005805]|uniref:class I SAM-dependent methyltransferase n=1 Tax=Streptomyces sp. NPDC005805 TaxID=3157068 RepID=UPI0033E62811